MRKLRTRAVALMLIASSLIGIASCGKEDYSEKILTCADFISEYARERKYVEIAAMSTGTDADLRSFMAMSLSLLSNRRSNMRCLRIHSNVTDPI